ncbi:GTPase HflX [Anaerorhabdus sp.]|uniref:GTPase HflX n=1 Tax=Anaerorhabdus sp. TaxID=1872524 RepID=UPI002FC6990D
METVILVGVNTLKVQESFQDQLDECIGLCQACNYDVVQVITQNMDYTDRQTCVGSGKLVEISEITHQQDIDKVVFLNRLSASQVSHITEALETEVLDRTGIILEIFAKRARTKEAQIQVEMATLQYELPRLALSDTSSDQQRGGSDVKNKGKGETKLELNRRDIVRRISQLKKELSSLDTQSQIQKQQRLKSKLPMIALVGYTNAGKSSLMNRILKINDANEDKQVMEKDMLFATLDTSVRKVNFASKKEFLLFDTVGFVSNLPTELIEAFKSTLAAAKEATLLLHVIDCSNERYEVFEKATEDTLKRIEANNIPVIKVYNKVDNAIDRDKTDGVYISCKTGEGILELLQTIEEKLYPNEVTVTCLIPYDQLSMIQNLKQNATIEFLSDDEHGKIVRVTCSKDIAQSIEVFQLGENENE